MPAGAGPAAAEGMHWAGFKFETLASAAVAFIKIEAVQTCS